MKKGDVVRREIIGAAVAAITLHPLPATARCEGRFAVEVLGSGGPLADDERASASYLVWIDGEARLLVDAGGGAFLRFGEAGAVLSTLDGILISHFHADHVADLVAILKSGSFEDGAAPLPVAGPSGSTAFPGLSHFLTAQFDRERGAYRYLSGYMTGEDGKRRLDAVEVDATAEVAAVVVERDGLSARAIPVNHGVVPALAYVVTAFDATVVFAGDQSLFSEFFETSLDGSRPDLLIAHHAISEAKGQPRGLHRPPSSIGEMAARMGAQRLILSHNMKRALDDWKAGKREIRKTYGGPVTIAHDRQCVTLVR